MATTIRQLKQQLTKAQKVEDAAERRRRRVEQQIGNLIAKTKGIVKGRWYYFLPTNGRKFLVEVRDIGTWSKYNSDNSIGILIRYHNRNGAYRSQWQYTNFGEFLPAPQPKKEGK